MNAQSSEPLDRRELLDRRGFLGRCGAAAIGGAVLQPLLPPEPRRSGARERSLADLRGISWVPASCQQRDNLQGMLGPDETVLSTERYPDGRRVPFGQFVGGVVERELEILATLGFGNVRFYGSFLAWLFDAPGYRRNLETIVNACDRLEMSITYVLWSTGLAEEVSSRPLHFVDWVVDHLGAGVLKNAFQWATDDWHRRRSAEIAPCAGTHFYSYAWTSPDSELLLIGGGPRSWDREIRFPQRIGTTLSRLIDAYLDDVANVFRSAAGRRVLFSYDLFNEPEVLLPAPENPDRLTGHEACVDFLVHCHERLARAHGDDDPAFTIGMVGPMKTLEYDWIPTFYRAMAERGHAMSYVSFQLYGVGDANEWSKPETWSDYVAKVVDQAQQLPTTRDHDSVLCGEFYAPYIWPNTRGHLGMIVDALDAAGIGGQVWSVLETNYFMHDAGAAVPMDGLIIPMDAPAGARADPDAVRFLRRTEDWVDRDFEALLGWTGGEEPEYG